MEKEEIERMEYPEDPERCQAIRARQGQCEFKGAKLPDGTRAAYCMLHGGNKSIEALQAGSLRQYRLGKWQAKLERFAESPLLKSLRDEIGILRILLEERLSFVNSPAELILVSGPISDLVMKVERVVTSCHKLEERMGHHLDKAAIIQLVGQITTIISVHLKNQPDLIDAISIDLLNLIQEEFKEEEL